MTVRGRTVAIDFLKRWKGFDRNMMPVDDLDIKILNELSDNCRDSNIQIAKRLRTSEATVRRRIRLMEENGIILGFSPQINYALVEDPVKVYISLKVDEAHRSRVIKKLCKHPYSLEVYSITGDSDILAVMFFSKVINYKEFVDEIKRLRNVKRATVQTVTRPHKGKIWSYI